MSNLDVFDYWVSNNEVQLFPREDPNNPRWCPIAQELVEYGRRLVEAGQQNPTRATIEFLEHRLHKRFWDRFHPRAGEKHRLDESKASHPCLFRAYREIRQAVEDLELLEPIPELQPSIPVLSTPAPRVIEGEVVASPPPAPELDAVLGAIVGYEDHTPAPEVVEAVIVEDDEDE